MRLLILGGTIFLGRHLVDAALARGHTVTLFNRGQHNAELFPQIEKLRGNRDGDLNTLRGKTWDAVIDPCGYFPRIVEMSARFLTDAVGHYTFISSISVYPGTVQPNADETAPVAKISNPAIEEITGETYGPLKALCEQAVERILPNRALVIRPGLIVGSHDPSDRFTYWVNRGARGGETLAPGEPSSRTQFIDVRDLAEWTIRMVEAQRVGIYNATGPDYPLTMQQALDECVRVTASGARLTWVAEQFLLDANVGAWIEMPLWVPEKENEVGMMQINCAKARADGLTFRPLAETIRDMLAWDATRPADYAWRAGMKSEREVGLLAQWRARQP